MQDIRKVYDVWLQEVMVADGDPDTIVGLYAPDALLLGTFSHTICHMTTMK